MVPMVAIASTAPVHTTGVNWASVVTITAAVVVIMTTVFSIVARYITSRIGGAVDRFRIEVVDKLDTRLTSVETTLVEISRNNPRYPNDPTQRSRRN